MTPRDLRNIHTTGNRCRDALPCVNMALKLPLYFYLLMKTQMLVVHFSCTSCYYFILFQWLPKLKFLSFITKVNPNNRSKTKSDIFPLDIFKSEIISFISKHIKVFQWLSKLKFVNFMTKVNPNNGNETKSEIFRLDHIFFIKTY